MLLLLLGLQGLLLMHDLQHPLVHSYRVCARTRLECHADGGARGGV
jgi:hypothetical protein